MTTDEDPESSLLLRTARTTPTEIWNDSCAVDELEHAIERGATGATSNPTLVLDVLRREPGAWRRRAMELAADHPTAGEADIAWRIAEEIAVRGARLLEPVFRASDGRQGRLSIQVDPSRYRDAEAMSAQAVEHRRESLRAAVLGTPAGGTHAGPPPQ